MLWTMELKFTMDMTLACIIPLSQSKKQPKNTFQGQMVPSWNFQPLVMNPVQSAPWLQHCRSILLVHFVGNPGFWHRSFVREPSPKSPSLVWTSRPTSSATRSSSVSQKSSNFPSCKVDLAPSYSFSS